LDKLRRHCFAAAARALAGPSPAALARQPTAENRLVIPVPDSDPAKWNLALNNALNVQTDPGAKNVEAEIVAYGPGIDMLRLDSVVGNRVADALGSGVGVVACGDTMHARKLAKPDVPNGIGYAGAGVVEIVRRRQERRACLRL
jgi:intracellular sulfur oxidation DsrE/DsrF family protein